MLPHLAESIQRANAGRVDELSMSEYEKHHRWADVIQELPDSPYKGRLAKRFTGHRGVGRQVKSFNIMGAKNRVGRAQVNCFYLPIAAAMVHKAFAFYADKIHGENHTPSPPRETGATLLTTQGCCAATLGGGGVVDRLNFSLNTRVNSGPPCRHQCRMAKEITTERWLWPKFCPANGP